MEFGFDEPMMQKEEHRNYANAIEQVNKQNKQKIALKTGNKVGTTGNDGSNAVE